MTGGILDFPYHKISNFDFELEHVAGHEFFFPFEMYHHERSCANIQISKTPSK